MKTSLKMEIFMTIYLSFIIILRIAHDNKLLVTIFYVGGGINTTPT